MAKVIIWIILVGYILFMGGFIAVSVSRERTTETPRPDLYSGVLIVQSDSGQGSCFVVAKREDYWYAITAAHVVETPMYMPPDLDGPSFTVDNEEYEIEIVDMNSDEDVALIRFKSPEKYRIYEMALAQIGESSTAVGWSRGAFLRYPGSVVSLDFEGFIVANGGIVPGCSGGPLLDKDGNAIGITVRIAVYRGQAFDSTALYVPARYAVALMIGSGVREF